MAPTPTSRLSLLKPDPLDLYDVGIPNENMDIIDRIGGTTVCTSTTRPNTPFSGMTIYETDTGITRSWVPGSPGTWMAISPGNAAFVCTSTTRPGTPGQGQMIYETDTGLMYIRVGASWVLLTNGVKGGKRYDTTTANLATLTSGSAGTETLAGMDTGNVFLEGSKLHRITARVEVASSVAGDSVTLRTRLTNISGAVWSMLTTGALRAAGVKQQFEFTGLVNTSASAGNRLFVVTAQRASGTGAITISAASGDVKPFVIVEQVSPDTGVTVV